MDFIYFRNSNIGIHQVSKHIQQHHFFASSREEKQEREVQKKKSKYKRYALIGLATVGGGTLIGETDNFCVP